MIPNQEGSITLWFAVLASALLAVVGLVWAGGDALAAKARAQSEAFAAARAGAQAVSGAGLAAGTVVLDPVAANQAAEAVLGAAGANGVVSVSGRTVSVTVSASVPGELLSLVGIATLEVRGSASATATPGT